MVRWRQLPVAPHSRGESTVVEEHRMARWRSGSLVQQCRAVELQVSDQEHLREPTRTNHLTRRRPLVLSLLLRMRWEVRIRLLMVMLRGKLRDRRRVESRVASLRWPLAIAVGGGIGVE